MKLNNMNTTNEVSFEQQKFNKTYLYVVGLTAIIIVFLAALIFMPIPESHQHNSDMLLIFLMTSLGAASGYLIGASPSQKSASQTNITTIPADATPAPIPAPQAVQDTTNAQTNA